MRRKSSFITARMALRVLPIACASVMFASLSPSASAQSVEIERVGQLWKGSKPVVVTVAQLRRRQDVSKPLVRKNYEQEHDFDAILGDPLAPQVARWPVLPGNETSVAKKSVDLIQRASWTGGSYGGVYPPDVQGAVGPTQVVMATNARIRVFDKAGNLGALDVDPDVLFGSILSTNSYTSDPRVRYDRTSQRWYIVMIDVGPNGSFQNNRVLIAVSSSATITNQSSFALYYFVQSSVSPAGDTGGGLDYPSLGVDANYLYIGGNIFNPGYTGSPLFVVSKPSLLAGGPIVASVFRNIGIQTPMGVDNDDPAATLGYAIGNVNTTTLGIRRVTAGATPSISATLNVAVPTTSTTTLTVPANGSTSNLDSLGTRLFNAALRTNRITGAQTLWTAHNIRINSSGVGSGTGDRDGCRWYEIGTLGTTPALVQSGTVYSNSATADYRWMDSVIMSGQGHALLGANAANTNRKADIIAAFRLSSDTAGTMQPEQLIQASSNSYNAGLQNGSYRWGDYTQMAVDPNDDMTFWGFHEFYDAATVWSVRIFSVAAPPPAAVSSLSQATIQQGQTANITVTGTSTNGSGFFEPGASFPNHLVASFSGTGLTVNSLTFTDPTHFTINVTAAANATVGARNLTVTNPDGQVSSLSSAITVTTSQTEVNPSGFTVSRGILLGGTTASLANSDDNYVVVKKGITLGSNESPIDVSVSGSSGLATITQLKAHIETHADTTGLTQTLWLFNYTTNAWVQVDARSATTSDTAFDITISSGAADYLGAGGAVQARLTVKQTGITLSSNWSLFIDQVHWTLN